jgi:hypothetical protein
LRGTFIALNFAWLPCWTMRWAQNVASNGRGENAFKIFFTQPQEKNIGKPMRRLILEDNIQFGLREVRLKFGILLK